MATFGGNVCYRIDYANVSYLPLTESALNEQLDVGGPAGDTGCPLFRPASPRERVLGHDGSRSVLQAAGASLLLFSDTFLGTWSSDGSRQISGAVHSSSALVQPADLATCFAGAIYQGTPPTEVLVHPPDEDTSTTAGWLEDSFGCGSFRAGPPS